jgi:hypothetical protein
MAEEHPRSPTIALELALLAAMWGGSIKLGVATIPPLTLIAARTSIAATNGFVNPCNRGSAFLRGVIAAR